MLMFVLAGCGDWPHWLLIVLAGCGNWPHLLLVILAGCGDCAVVTIRSKIILNKGPEVLTGQYKYNKNVV